MCHWVRHFASKLGSEAGTVTQTMVANPFEVHRDQECTPVPCY